MNAANVLFLEPLGEKGGAEVVLVDLAAHVDRARFNPIVVTLRPGPLVAELTASGVDTLSLQAHRTRQVHRIASTIRQLRNLIRERDVRLVHANGGSMLLYAALASRGLGVPVVWHVHDPLSGRGLWERVVVAVQRRLRPTATIFANEAVAASYTSTYRHLGSTAIIRPGIEVDQLKGDPARGRAAIGLPDTGDIVAMFARLQRHKAQHHLVGATPAIAAGRDVHVVLVGGALFGFDQDYPSELRTRAHELGVEEIVHMPGFVDDRTRDDLLAASTVVVHCADHEPFGIAVIEGMAAGKPVVVTDAAGPATTVVHRATGLVVPRGDEDALAGAVASLLDDPDLAQRLGRAGRERAQRDFSIKAMVERTEQVYDQVLAPPPP